LNQVSIPPNLEKIGESAFEKCYSLKEIIFPETLIYIGKSSFRFNRDLFEVVFPKNLRFIGDGAFYGCIGLKAIYISPNFKNDILRIFGDIDPSIIHWIE
jgi:hypothetical protein